MIRLIEFLAVYLAVGGAISYAVCKSIIVLICWAIDR